MHAILKRNELTDVWKENGIDGGVEYAILTNDIYKGWSGMTAQEYKEYKGIRKENLRDNMADIEIILTDLGETVTRDIARNEKPVGLSETGLKAITKENKINYKYKKDISLKEKFEKYNGENLAKDFEWDDARGKEIW